MNIFISIIIFAVVSFALLTFFIFVVPSLPFFNGAKIINKNLSNQYYYRDEKVVYVSDANFFSLGEREIEEADKNSFEVLAYNYAKDKDSVYYQEILLIGIDSNNIELMAPVKHEGKDNYTSYYYLKDKTKVFYLYIPIEDADAQSFSYLRGYYSADKDSLFYSEKKIANKDNSFEFLKRDFQNEYIQMSNKLFYKGELVQTEYNNDLELLKYDFSKDKKDVYHHAKKCEGIDTASFTLIDEHYQRDKDNLYYNAQKIDGSDPDSYEYINFYFSKDKTQVYYFGYILIGANAETFTLKEAKKLDDDNTRIILHYDNTHIFYASRSDFHDIKGIYSQYKSDIYVTNQRLIGANLKDLKILGDEESSYAQSSGKTFYYTSEIPNADLDTFTTINEKFAKDKTHVYWMEKELVGIKPEKFKYQDGMYGEEIDAHRATLIYPKKEDIY